MNIVRTILPLLGCMVVAVAFNGMAMSLSELHHIKKGRFFLTGDGLVEPVVRLVLNKHEVGQYEGNIASPIEWYKTPDGLQIRLLSPETLGEYTEQGVVFRAEVHQWSIQPAQTRKGVEYVQHTRVVRTDTMDVVDTAERGFVGTLLPEHEMNEWQVDLAQGTWSLPAVDYAFYDAFNIPAFGSVDARFFVDGTGQMVHHDKRLSRFKWRIKGNQLVLKYRQDGMKRKLSFRIAETLADIGLRVVMHVQSQNDTAPMVRTGLMLQDQGTRFSYENAVGTWLNGTVRYDYYDDHVYIPNIAFQAATWAFTQAGEIERQKIVHPELGTVPVCPDDTCYVSCTFTLKLLARDEEAMYVSIQTDSELVDGGPHFFMGKTVAKFEVKPHQRVSAFDYSWLGMTTMTFKSESDSTPYFFAMMPSTTGAWEYMYSKGVPSNVEGKFSVVDGKLHLETPQGTHTLEITHSTRDSLEVCRYDQGGVCGEGDNLVLEFHNGTHLLD
ncbi:MULTISPECIES: hypothetical protein [unclassified Pseudoalteromonas]|uniref:hypothetical protein n=1 Tax=unclassified Pseudoalteromonas TaxID=194690 RepID=UPI002097B2E8|nr:hypothetical protein [Pseudoalteromonas sp. XMcav2-N]MCO7190660.1 hypothetical protein [Pseudoalteromonas sp. XMcav2-N]